MPTEFIKTEGVQRLNPILRVSFSLCSTDHLSSLPIHGNLPHRPSDTIHGQHEFHPRSNATLEVQYHCRSREASTRSGNPRAPPPPRYSC